MNFFKQRRFVHPPEEFPVFANNVIGLARLTRDNPGLEEKLLVEGTHLDFKYLLDAGNELSGMDWHRICRNAQLLWQDPEIIYRVASRGPKNLNPYEGLLGAFFGIFSDPVLTAAAVLPLDIFLGKLIPTLNGRFNPNSEAKPLKIGDSHAVYQWRFRDEVWPKLDLNDCRSVKGFLRSFPMLYGAPPAEVKEPHCCIQVKNIDWIDGKGYRVEGNKVFEFLVDRETLEPVQGTEQELPERLSPDGAFKIGGTVYGSRACEYHLEFQPMGFPSKLWRRTGARAVAYFFSGKTMEKELERSRRLYDEAQLLLTEKVAALERTEVALAKQVELSGQLQQVHGQLKEMYTTLEVRAKALAGELEAQRANIELASLVRGLGHHIKGPLGAVQSTLDGMGTVLKSLESAVSPDYLELLQGQMGIAISNAYEASRFIDIITRVVAAGKPGNIYAQPAGNYVRETLQPAVQSLRRDYPSIPFEESYSSTTPVGVNDQIKIALNHLMVNANEEMQRGNIIPAKPFRISVYDGDGGVYISVTSPTKAPAGDSLENALMHAPSMETSENGGRDATREERLNLLIRPMVSTKGDENTGMGLAEASAICLGLKGKLRIHEADGCFEARIYLPGR